MKMDRLPEKGETITDAGFFQVYGGKGVNQAVGAARAGGKVAFVNCVGNDAYTPQMLENFRNDGLDIRFVFQETDIASGHALVMIGGEGNNYLSVAPGANYKLTPELIDRSMPVIDEAAMIIMQYEIPVESKGDIHSNFDGKTLISKKVKEFVIMGGQYPEGKKEWNFDGNMPGITNIIKAKS